MSVGSLFSALLHGGLLALLLWSFNEANGGMPNLGTGDGSAAFEVVIALPGSAPAEDAQASSATEDTPTEVVEAEVPPPPPPAHAPTPPPPPPAPEPVPQPVVEAPDLPTAPIGPDPNVLLPVAEQEPEPEVTPEPPEELVLEEVTEPEPLEQAAEIEPEEAPPEPETSMVPPEKPLKPVVVPAPQLVEKPKPKPEQVAELPDQGEQDTSSTAAQAGEELAALPGDTGETAVGSLGTPGPAGGAVLGMSNSELASYQGTIQAWLEKYKRYPDRARRRNEQGVVMVEFAIDGRGHVLSHRLITPSGYQLLDAEAEALLARASPFPAPPNGAGLSMTVPISFALR